MEDDVILSYYEYEKLYPVLAAGIDALQKELERTRQRIDDANAAWNKIALRIVEEQKRRAKNANQ